MYIFIMTLISLYDKKIYFAENNSKIENKYTFYEQKYIL